MDYALLREGIRSLSELCCRLSTEVERIAGYTENMDIFWDGDANSAYMSAVSADLVEMGAVLLRIRRTVKAADNAFAAYMENEKKVSAVIADFWKRNRGCIQVI